MPHDIRSLALAALFGFVVTLAIVTAVVLLGNAPERNGYTIF